MAQMAIKNEVNTFTIHQFFNANILLNDGSAGAVPYTFASSQATGMFLNGAVLSFATVGSTRFTIEASRIRFTPPLRPDNDGTVSAPVYSFFNEPNTGMFRFAAQVLDFAIAGVTAFRVVNNNIRAFQTLREIDGVVAEPAYSFTSETATGMFRIAPGELAFGTNGRTRLKLKDTGVNSFLQGSATLGVSLSFETNTSIVAYAIQFEGTAGFQPGQFSISRFNRTTGAFIDIPLYINASTGRVHTALPVLSP